SVLSNPTICYHTPGTYPVSLKLTNSSGSDELSQADFITVTYGGLAPDVTADKVVLLAGQEVTFTDQTEGIAESSSWEFISDKGVVVTANEQNPVVKFTGIVVYDAKLNVSNPDPTQVIMKEDYIAVLDPASIQADFVEAHKTTS